MVADMLDALETGEDNVVLAVEARMKKKWVIPPNNTRGINSRRDGREERPTL